ncbi:protein CutA homolog [Gouania willdenowi]|uniref:Protein CutA homolog n=1 Tax=Gouania willdenowi TaxID=441366 RepID=A0A8C5EKY5_GOUWI|nr:protein CutA homolog [Gouania willdenowi]
MTVVSGTRMECLYQRWPMETALNTARPFLLMFTMFFILVVSMYPGLWCIGIRLCSIFTGSYVPGHHCVLLINSPNEQTAKDISRALMERRLAATINILPRTSTMYYWKGEIQDATEILMLMRTKSSKVQQVVDYVRSIHPYANPEVLSFLVDGGSLDYMKWMDEAVSD